MVEFIFGLISSFIIFLGVLFVAATDIFFSFTGLSLLFSMIVFIFLFGILEAIIWATFIKYKKNVKLTLIWVGNILGLLGQIIYSSYTIISDSWGMLLFYVLLVTALPMLVVKIIADIVVTSRTINKTKLNK